MMRSVTLTIENLDAETPAEAVRMFLAAAQNAEPLYFSVVDDFGNRNTVSSDEIREGR